MEKIRLHFFILFSIFISFHVSAQLADGTPAPDWTATDINGEVHDMSDILASGKHVVLEFSAIWCGPCWNYHNTGTLETLHDLYGPDGTDEIRVFYVEADLGTNTNCLYGPAGCNSNTQGDWVTGHDFTFIDLASDNAPGMASSYSVSFYPTVYAISGNGDNGVFYLGQQTNINVWDNWFFESFEMEIQSSVTPATCPGEGSISMSTTNGYGGISYSWSNGESTETISGLDPGMYTVSVEDQNGYILTETIEVEGPSDGPLTLELDSQSDVLCNGESNGSIEINVSGGNSGYQFEWSNGETTEDIFGLEVGEYSVLITDSEGCTETESFVIEEPFVLETVTFALDANCGAEDGSVVADGYGGTPPYSFSYGDGTNSTGTFNNIPPGDYVMEITDVNFCTAFSPFSIMATELPEVMLQATGSIDCSTTEVLVTSDGSTQGDMSYLWTSNDGNISGDADGPTVMVDQAGTYTLELTNNETGCVAYEAVSVMANIDAPMASISDAGTLDCNATMLTLDGSGSESGSNIVYSWTTDDGNISNGANTTQPEIDAPGTYTLLVTNTDNGCTSEEAVTVELDDAEPMLSVSDVVLDCVNVDADLCADVADNTLVTWTTPEGEVEGNCITVSMAGTYVALARGTNGCETTAEALVTLSADLPQVSIAQPDAITCTVPMVTIEASLEGELSDFDITWTAPAGEILNNTNLSIEVEDAGVYTLEVVNTANGCTTTNSVEVDEIIVNPISGFTTTLDEGVLNLESEAGGDPSTYSWSFGSTDANTTTMFDETGTYEICLTVTNDCGEDTYCEEVYFVSELKFEGSSSNTLCYDEDSGSITVEPSGGEPGYTISWVGPNGYTSTELSISGLAVGEYNMVLNDAYGYEKSATYMIDQPTEIVQVLVEIIDETNSDGNGQVVLEVMGGTGDLTYEWSNGATTSSIEELPSGDYSVIVTDANGCDKEFGPFAVESNTVSVSDLHFVSKLSLYPIPANNYLNVNITLSNPVQTQMRVLDAYGKVILSQSFNSKEISTAIDVTTMTSGVYYLEFGNQNGRSLEKFVVIK